MKLLFILLFISSFATAQINPLCKDRGHVASYGADTGCEPVKLDCPDAYVIDTDTSSVIIYPACGYDVCKCMRCGEKFKIPYEDMVERIWPTSKDEKKSKQIIIEH